MSMYDWTNAHMIEGKEDEIKNVWSNFRMLDRDNNGNITLEELKMADADPKKMKDPWKKM